MFQNINESIIDNQSYEEEEKKEKKKIDFQMYLQKTISYFT